MAGHRIARAAASLGWAFSALVAGTALVQAQMATSSQWAQVRTLVELPDDRLDPLAVQLAIDRIVDPTLDAASTTRALESLLMRIEARLPPAATARAKLDVLLSSLYQPGPWNDWRPFSYDLDDPTGKDLRTKLLGHYLRTRKGNCVSMPILVLILGQQLGLRVTLAAAPNHLLVKYLADDGQWLNVEATSGGFKYDSSYEREMQIPARAIDSGIYLRPMSPREAVGHQLGTLMEHYGRNGRPHDRIAVADLALAQNARDIGAMLHAASGYSVLLEWIRRRYPDPADIPPEQHEDVRHMQAANLGLFARAESLGWTEPTPEQQRAYLESIEREKARRGADR
jgi:regulator of sirC expression with transglutaminase-like and TPR domain